MKYFALMWVFLRSTKATAAVEFALVFPVALLIYVGAAEVADGVMTSRKVTTVARTLVDLVSLQATSSQATSTPTPSNAIPSTTLSTLMTSATTLLYPEPTNSLSMTVSAIDVTNNASGLCCSATVRWTYTQSGSLRPCAVQLTGSTATNLNANQMPSELLPVGTILPRPLSFLVAEVSYTYQPIMNVNLLNFMPSMRRSEYMMPRSLGQVITGPLPATGPQTGVVCY